MSSLNSIKSKAWLRFAAVLALAAGLAGCFQPMYGRSTQLGAGPNLRDALREVEVLEVSGRLGQELRNDLIFELTGGEGNPAGAPFALALSVTSSSQTPLVDVQSGRALAETVTLDVVYTLRDTNNKKVVLTEKALARVTIDRSQQRFAATRAVRDAQNRAAKIVAEQIRSRVASYFLTRT
jgi:LPS-assembly lipoprotein